MILLILHNVQAYSAAPTRLGLEHSVMDAHVLAIALVLEVMLAGASNDAGILFGRYLISVFHDSSSFLVVGAY